MNLTDALTEAAAEALYGGGAWPFNAATGYVVKHESEHMAAQVLTTLSSLAHEGVLVVDFRDDPSGEVLRAESDQTPTPLTAMDEIALRREGRAACAMGHHAWVPWLQMPNGTSWTTWCARGGCEHVEQWDM